MRSNNKIYSSLLIPLKLINLLRKNFPRLKKRGKNNFLHHLLNYNGRLYPHPTIFCWFLSCIQSKKRGLVDIDKLSPATHTTRITTATNLCEVGSLHDEGKIPTLMLFRLANIFEHMELVCNLLVHKLVTRTICVQQAPLRALCAECKRAETNVELARIVMDLAAKYALHFFPFPPQMLILFNC